MADRLAVDIPVIGPLRTAMHAALTLADRVGITVPLASHLPYTRRILRSYGLESFVSGIKPIGVYGKDIKARKAEIFDITCKLIRALVDEGAEIIVPLGGALIPYVVDPAELRGHRRTGAEHQGHLRALCRDVREFPHDAKRDHLSARKIVVDGLHGAVLAPASTTSASRARPPRRLSRNGFTSIDSSRAPASIASRESPSSALTSARLSSGGLPR